MGPVLKMMDGDFHSFAFGGLGSFLFAGYG